MYAKLALNITWIPVPDLMHDYVFIIIINIQHFEDGNGGPGILSFAWCKFGKIEHVYQGYDYILHQTSFYYTSKQTRDQIYGHSLYIEIMYFLCSTIPLIEILKCIIK